MANDSERFRESDRRQLAGEAGRPETIGRPEADEPANGAKTRWNNAQWVGGDRRHEANDAAAPAGDESSSTRIRGHLRTELVPWDDADFVREYEGAHEQVVREGLLINGPRAAARLEELMRDAGYPHVSVKVERTIDEALRHAARWTVRRDGEPAPDQE